VTTIAGHWTRSNQFIRSRTANNGFGNYLYVLPQKTNATHASEGVMAELFPQKTASDSCDRTLNRNNVYISRKMPKVLAYWSHVAFRAFEALFVLDFPKKRRDAGINARTFDGCCFSLSLPSWGTVTCQVRDSRHLRPTDAPPRLAPRRPRKPQELASTSRGGPCRI
jgi:hypothetical protein